MDEKMRRSLARHQVASIRRWLEEPEAKVLVVRAAHDLLEAADERIGADLVDPEAVEAAIRGLFAGDVRARLVRPIAAAVVRQAGTRVAARPERLGAVLGEASTQAWRDLAARGDVLDPHLVRAALVDPAVEAIMRDVLLDALRQFNDRVNPFFAEWGLPALVAAVPLGKRALEKALEQVRKEFDRRLEPEMGRFLERFAKHSLERLARSLVDGAGDPEMISLRRHLAQVVLEASLSRLTWPPDDPRGSLVADGVVAAVDGVLSHPAVESEVVAAWWAMWDEVGSRTVGALREAHGVAFPPVDDVVDAAWPGVRAAFSEEALVAPLIEVLARSMEGWEGLE